MKCTFCFKPIFDSANTSAKDNSIRESIQKKEKNSSTQDKFLSDEINTILLYKNIIKHNQLMSESIEKVKNSNLFKLDKQYNKNTEGNENDEIVDSGAVSFSLPCPALMNRGFKVRL